MVLIGAISIFRGALLAVAQIVGAISAAFAVQGLFTGKLNVSTTLSATTTTGQGVVIEMLLTAKLVFTIFMLAAEKHSGNFIAPIGIGLSLFVGELTGTLQTTMKSDCCHRLTLPRCVLDRRLYEPGTFFRTKRRPGELRCRAVGVLRRPFRRLDSGRRPA